MPELSKQSLDALIELGVRTAGPQAVPGGNTPYVLVPNGYSARALPELIWNEHNAHPQRIKASVEVLDAGSFIEYYQNFSDVNSQVFADERSCRVSAALDYHAAGEGNSPRWCDHNLVLILQQSEEWVRWIGKNNQQFSQQAFAEFLEQNSIDIARPDPASMLEVARDLQASTEVEFGSAIRMNDGQVRFRYTETTKASVGSGQVSVPENFTLSVPAFVGGDRVPMDALLRFRVNQGKLAIWYTLVRPEQVVRDAFQKIRAQIAETLKVGIVNGSVRS